MEEEAEEEREGKRVNLSEMKRILSESDLRLTKSLGQNFLHDGNQLRRIVAAGDLQLQDRVLEIGPGLGPLTEALLEEVGFVRAIEKDGRLVRFLTDRFKGEERLEVLHEDAMDFLRRSPEQDWRGWKLVSNLPYSVGSPILVELALAPNGPDRMVATLQWEVVQRIRAVPGSKEYGLLSLLIQLGYEPLGSFKVPAGCFYPQPDVASACVTLQRRPEPLLSQSDVGHFVRLIKAGFSQRRKTMMKLLKPLWPEDRLEFAYAELGIPLQARAESLSLAQFVRLTDYLRSNAKE